MLSLPLYLHLALLVTAYLCLRMVARIGGGREIVTIRRRSEADVETTWANLLAAWDETGLTFAPAVVRDAEDGTRIVSSRPEGQPIVFNVFPPDPPHSIVVGVAKQGDRDYPQGRNHFEHWRVEADGAGSMIVVQTRFAAPLLATVRNLWSLWRQVGVLASPRAGDVVAALGAQVDTGPGRSVRSPVPKRPAPVELPSHYGREAVISLVAFAYLLTQYEWRSAIALSAVILWHEYGHLLAYQLTGKTGNRLMLVPFFGGIAVSGAPHRNQLEKAFCALMGPGICVPLTLGTFALWYYNLATDYDDWLWKFFFFSSMLNLLNLLPVYPLDGGQTAESMLRSFLPSSIVVHLSGLAIASLVILVGYEFYEMATFVGLFSLMSLRTLPAHSPLPPMSGRQAASMVMFYAVNIAAHGGVFLYISTNYL